MEWNLFANKVSDTMPGVLKTDQETPFADLPANRPESADGKLNRGR